MSTASNLEGTPLSPESGNGSPGFYESSGDKVVVNGGFVRMNQVICETTKEKKKRTNWEEEMKPRGVYQFGGPMTWDREGVIVATASSPRVG